MELRDPVSQMNLYLNLALQSSGGAVRPIFREWGYRIVGLGKRLSIDPIRYAHLKDRVDIKHVANPDIVLTSASRKCLLTIECKTQSFDSDLQSREEVGSRPKSPARQARTLLLLSPKEIAETLGVDAPEGGLLAYALGLGSASKLRVSLTEIEEELKRLGQSTVDWCVWALSIRSDGIYLDNLREHPALGEDGDVRIVRTDDSGWEPFRYIPIDPTINALDPQGLEDLREMLRSAIAERMLKAEVGVLRLDIESICQTAILVWEVWDAGAKKWVTDKAKQYMSALSRILERAGAKISRASSREFAVEIADSHVLRVLKKAIISPAYLSDSMEAGQERQIERLFDEPK